ncbi:hypothetical protein DTO164E3_3917 [Paecilomyces variotii]|nr:hypothetical protein DTO164E3_3917 [Paecilomyces variotii]KAJ9290891.1 hypothetical protein DTO021C3_1485 [Paecilomyces variotii]
MGFFDHLQKGGGFSLQPKKPQIRKVVTQTRPAVPARTSSAAASPAPAASSRSAVRQSKARPVSGDSRQNTPQKRLGTAGKIRKRPSPAQRLSSDDDDSDTDTSFEVRKRARVSASAEPDPDRRVRDTEMFSEKGKESFRMVHAADIASLEKPGKFKRAFDKTDKPVDVWLQYPGASQKERYQLIVPRDKDDFRPLDDIVQVIEMVSQNYVPDDERDVFDNDSTGIKRRVRRALAHGSESDFRDAIADYNSIVEQLKRNGSIAKHLDSIQRLTLPLVERILTQTYSRTVSPRVESLRQYENGTDNVYGELLPRFISTIFKETKLKSGQVFVDLGSGVANVVLQAALEIGCESWGCEMMQNACDLAELQEAEFKARCRLWGIAPGETHLVRGDFLKEESIAKVLQRADVVLINNQAFTPQLNDKLVNHFLDMKEGCQIVSLKSFVPGGHKIQSRNLNSPLNLLSVKQRNYWSDSVSWTDVGGTYFIATKDSSRLKRFVESMG